MRKKTSLIWKISKDELIVIVQASSSIREILSYFNLKNKGSNYRTLYKKFEEDNIDYTHIKLGLNNNSGRKFNVPKIPLSEILTKNSTYNRSNLKERLISENILKYECFICGQLPEWNNKPLTLQLDHINGISDDNRLENLRILCPHCHSQTENYAGKNKKNKVLKPSQINPNWRCEPNLINRKIERPTKEELEKLLWEKPTSQLAKEFGVSDNAIAKWAKTYGITKPPRGYWNKIKIR